MEDVAERYRRKQRQRAAAEYARRKKDRKLERVRGFSRPPVDEEVARARAEAIHARLFPYDTPEFLRQAAKVEHDMRLTQVAVEKSQSDAKLSMMGPPAPPADPDGTGPLPGTNP